MPENDYKTAQLLREAREAARVTQNQAATYFGLSGKKGRDSIRAWETGTSKSERPRSQFISYLWEMLDLKSRPEQMYKIWNELVVGKWGYSPLEKWEIPKDPPFQIPKLTSKFYGRNVELSQLVAYLQEMVLSGQIAVSAIWGMSGIGKTRLAYEVAHQVRELFDGGQLLVTLTGEARLGEQSEETVVLQEALKRVIRALTYDENVPDQYDELVTRYHEVLENRRVLILIDNVSNMAEVEVFIPPPGSALLVTSRRVITLTDIKSVRLMQLEPTAAADVLLTICPAIGTHASQVAQLCGYHPYALSITAGTVRFSPIRPEVYLEELRQADPKRLLELGDPHDLESSVKTSLLLSYDKLNTELQSVLLQLSVFPSSFDVVAVQAVVQGVNAVSDLLVQLYWRSMVEWNSLTERYALHDLTRAFCVDRLADRKAVERRHAEYYATVARQVDMLYANHDLQGALDLFDLERIHIDAGWAWAERHAGDQDADKLLITYGKGTYHVGELRYDRQQKHLPKLQVMCEAARRLADQVAERNALHYIGNIYYLIRDWAAATSSYEQALTISREEGDLAKQVSIANNLGLIYRETDSNRAITVFQDCIRISQEIRDQLGEVFGFVNLGFVYLQRDQFVEAETNLNSALTLSQAINDPINESAALTYLGQLYQKLGNIDQAIKCYEQSLIIDRRLGDQEGEANACWLLGELLMKGDPKRALELMEQAHAYACQIEHPIAKKQKTTLDTLRRQMKQSEQD